MASTIGTGNNGRTNAQNITLLALQSCLGQWNDWTPSNTRYFVKRWNDDRLSGDIRADFKVSDNLSVYVKHSRSKGDVISYTSNLGFGGIGTIAAANAFVRGPNGFNGAAAIDTNALQSNGAGGIRTLNPASGYFLYPDLTYRAGSTTGSVIQNPGLNGTVANINPASVVVDSNHHVTSFQIADGVYGVDNTTITTGTKSDFESPSRNSARRMPLR